jgi:hypothetical protein
MSNKDLFVERRAQGVFAVSPGPTRNGRAPWLLRERKPLPRRDGLSPTQLCWSSAAGIPASANRISGEALARHPTSAAAVRRKEHFPSWRPRPPASRP